MKFLIDQCYLFIILIIKTYPDISPIHADALKLCHSLRVDVYPTQSPTLYPDLHLPKNVTVRRLRG